MNKDEVIILESTKKDKKEKEDITILNDDRMFLGYSSNSAHFQRILMKSGLILLI